MRLRFPIAVYRVAERSMEPTIRQGDYLLVSRIHGRLREGDIVVLRHPAKNIDIVKRIRRIEGGRVFVEGDNKDESEDSRSFGAVPVKTITGKMLIGI